MNFTQEQISEVLSELATRKDGYHQVLRLCLEAIMKAERDEFNEVNGDLSNGYRYGKVYSEGHQLELVIPRSRHYNFYPMILALIKNQNREYEDLAYELYTAGLTTEQVGSLFDKIYGRTYSKSSISNMMSSARKDVSAWLNRSDLDEVYPVIYIDATYWSTRREDSVSKEAYYTILAVKQDRTREVLSIVNHPTEGATNWLDAFEDLKKRGVAQVQLVVCDGLTGIENAIAQAFPSATIQLCTVHLARNISAKVKPIHKAQIAAELKEVLNPDLEKDSREQGINRFHAFINTWLKMYPSLKIYLLPRSHYYFNYLNYEKAIRRMIYTTNWIERLNRNYKRTLRMRTSMPNPESVVFLLGSTAMKRKEYAFPIFQFSNSSKLNFK
jgi:transposase-like protein